MVLTNGHDALGSLKLLIYDLDGTLVDAFADIWSGVNFALTAHGLATVTMDEVRTFVGDGARFLVERCIAHGGIAPGAPHYAPLVSNVYRTFMEYYETHPAETVQPYAGAAETLRTLRALGLRQAILTNKPHSIAHPLCEKLGLADLVDGIWGARPGEPLKPDAEAILQITRHFQIAPGETAMIGDGLPDHAVARAAGTKMIAVNYGQLSREKNCAQTPAATIDALEELATLVRGN